MEITVKLLEILKLQEGIGKNGPWKKQDILVETMAKYPKKICISLWGDKFNQDDLKIGNILDIKIDIESRDFNGKWFTDIKAINISLFKDQVEKAENKNNYFDDIIFKTNLDDRDILPF